MKLLTSLESRKILGIKNYGAFVYRILQHNIKAIESKVIKGRYTKYYSDKDIKALKKKIAK